MRLSAERFFLAIALTIREIGTRRVMLADVQLSMAQASAVMIATLIASRILGWLRLSVIGAQFAGDPRQLDAFWAAFRIPDTIYSLLVAGALSSAFIPVFSSYLAKE